MTSAMPHTTVPGLDERSSAAVVEQLEARLASLLDLSLTLKHVHWNVVGPMFRSVHEMLDDHVDAVRAMADETAERMRTLGGTPQGTPQAIVDTRTWSDYEHGRASVLTHLEALDRVYAGVISDHRGAIARVGGHDPVSESMLVDQTAQLELFQWFVRSFRERAAEADAVTEPSAAVRRLERRDAHVRGHADRPATPEEAEAAERGAADVDVESVGSSYREMTRIGVETEGEGRI